MHKWACMQLHRLTALSCHACAGREVGPVAAAGAAAARRSGHSSLKGGVQPNGICYCCYCPCTNGHACSCTGSRHFHDMLVQGVKWGQSLPPVLLLHGTADTCALVSNAAQFSHALEEAGAEVGYQLCMPCSGTDPLRYTIAARSGRVPDISDAAAKSGGLRALTL